MVHLAAIPAPGLRPDELTFRVNTASTYNVFAAAPLVGLRRKSSTGSDLEEVNPVVNSALRAVIAA